MQVEGLHELRLCGYRCEGFILGELVGWKLKAWQVHRLGLGLSGRVRGLLTVRIHAI